MDDTRNEDIVKKYFDLVQEEIKKLISEDTEIKPEQVETFNNEIFNQPDEIRDQIKSFIDRATMNDLDIKRIAKIIYDKFKLQVKNNVFNQKDSQEVPNTMMGERKFIKTYERFLFEFQGEAKPKWSNSDFEILIKQLEDKLVEAKKHVMIKLPEMGNRVVDIKYGTRNFFSDLDRLLALLRKLSPKAQKLATEIMNMMQLIALFDREQEDEISKLN